ncbi:MAG: ABC transporter transmembrane domain-containing protein, partial [Actinomycetota bacterium]
MSSRRRLTAMLRPVAGSMAASVVARIVQLSAGLFLVAGGAWGAASMAEGRLDSPGALAAALAGAAAVKAVARYLEQYRGHDVAFGLLASMRSEFFRRVEPLAPAALADTRSGDLVERVMSDVDRVEVFFAHTVAPAVAGVAVPALTLAGLAWWADPRLAALVGVAMALVGWLVPWLADRSARESARVAAAASGDLAAHITDSTQGLADTVLFSYGDRRDREMDDRAARLAGAE